MDQAVREALTHDRVVDITTTGRRSRQPRRIETWLHRADGRIYLTGSPGKRDWYANLLADPSFTLHLKGAATADLAATAQPIDDPAERRRILGEIVAGLGARAASSGRPAPDLQAWLDGSPLALVVLADPLA